MATIRSIALPENDSERKAIKYLQENLPDDYTVFTNLELPSHGGLPYEYDMIIIGEYAVYSVEVKGYRGEIKGNAFEWELESGAIYRSPIPLANKKAKILGDRLKRYSSVLDNVWVQSLILMTDDQCRVKINDPLCSSVVHLSRIKDYILDPANLSVSTKLIKHYKTNIEQAIVGQFKPLRRSQDIGDYHVLETMGKNNLYTTMLAEHRLIPDRKFVLKVYGFNIYDSLELQKKHREWILRDANAIFHLGSHPSIVQAHPPFPWQDNQIVFPAEWIEGHSLRSILQDGVYLEYSRKIEIVRQICEGLEYIHQHKVIHRDIRPENIIIPKKGNLKLVNFDCARMDDGNLQTIATRIGRYLDERYVAPEVWENPKYASQASDLFALGILLFEIMAGHPPYEHISELYNMHKLPKMITQIDPRIPTEVNELIEILCAFDPKERFRSATDVIELIRVIEQ